MRKDIKGLWAVGLAAAALLGVVFGASLASAAELPPSAQVLALAEGVADWQIAHREDFSRIPTAGRETRSSRDWQQGAFYAGLTELADRSASPRFRDAVVANGLRNAWRLGDRPSMRTTRSLASPTYGRPPTGRRRRQPSHCASGLTPSSPPIRRTNSASKFRAAASSAGAGPTPFSWLPQPG